MRRRSTVKYPTEKLAIIRTEVSATQIIHQPLGDSSWFLSLSHEPDIIALRLNG